MDGLLPGQPLPFPHRHVLGDVVRPAAVRAPGVAYQLDHAGAHGVCAERADPSQGSLGPRRQGGAGGGALRPPRPRLRAERSGPARLDGARERSEEHTSELQSLMRISYAVFCLKKKKKKQKSKKTHTITNK